MCVIIEIIKILKRYTREYIPFQKLIFSNIQQRMGIGIAQRTSHACVKEEEPRNHKSFGQEAEEFRGRLNEGASIMTLDRFLNRCR